MATTNRRKNRKNPLPPLVLDASARDFQVLGSLAAMKECSKREAPICLFAYHDFDLPVTKETFARIFAPQINPFSNEPDMDCGFATNLLNSSLSVCAPTVITCAKVILQTNTQHWTVPVATVPAPVAGGVQPAIGAAAAGRGAINHGWPGNEIIEAFSRMYNLRIMLCRSQWLDESVSVLGRLPADPSFEGAGAAQKAVNNEVRCMNDFLRDSGNPNRVLTQNVVTVADTGEVCAAGPVVNVMKGGSENRGVGGYKFSMGFPVCPQQPLIVSFDSNQDPDCICALEKNSMITCETQDENFSASIAQGTGAALSCAPFCTYPQASVRIGVALCGYELTWDCFADYIAMSCMPGSAVAQTMTSGLAGNQVNALIQRFGDPTGRLRKMLGAKPSFRDRIVQEGQ